MSLIFAGFSQTGRQLVLFGRISVPWTGQRNAQCEDAFVSTEKAVRKSLAKGELGR